MYSRIRDEGFRHSHAMDYASALFDDIGPRLTGSPAMTRANDWTKEQLTAMGCSNAHLESWGDFCMAWTQISASLEMVKPVPAVFPRAGDTMVLGDVGPDHRRGHIGSRAER